MINKEMSIKVPDHIDEIDVFQSIKFHIENTLATDDSYNTKKVKIILSVEDEE